MGIVRSEGMAYFCSRKPKQIQLNYMKLLKLLPFALFALVLTACGDDEDDKETNVTGKFTTVANGLKYAEDEVHVDAILDANASKLTIIVDEVTASPAHDDKPASVLTDFTLYGMDVVADGGKYTFDANLGANGFGTMNGEKKACKQCHVMGTLEGKKLFFTMEYKFTESPMAPLLSSTYNGTCSLSK